jgi:anti-sigma B factor antagonist
MSVEDRDNRAGPSGEEMDVCSRDGFVIELQRPAPGVIVLRVEGELDVWTSLPLMDAIIEAFHEHPELIAVDASDVVSIDGFGLRVLVEGAGHIEAGRVRFAVIRAGGSEVARLLEQTDASRTLTVHESVDDALQEQLGAAGELPAGARSSRSPSTEASPR